MYVHEQVLEIANQVASERSNWTFGVDEVVRALPHLNQSSVRTHVVSRCCVNAPKNHPHKWDYFRRLSRGRYQVLPEYRRAKRAVKAALGQRRPESSKTPTATRAGMRATIHAVIQKDEGTYVAECMELAVVTQGSTLDEVTENLRQAVALHVEGEDMATLGLTEHPRLQIIYDAPLAS
jgi:predicted RNase H-like HicB family nuclease